MAHSTSLSSTENRALQLLGAGHTPAIVAATCGVTESRISQLLSDPTFLHEVSELRFAAVQKYTELDNKYDDLEKRLSDQLKDCLCLLTNPMQILKALGTINALKRRGATASPEASVQGTVVSITLPSIIVNKFTTNIHNQVISAGTQDLVTVQSHQMARLADAKTNKTPELAE